MSPERDQEAAVGWSDRNVHLKDGEVPVEELLARAELEVLHVAFVPTEAQVQAIDQRLLPRFPELQLRLYQLDAGSDLSVLGGLTSLKHLRLEHEVRDPSFLGGLDALDDLLVQLKRGFDVGRVPWPAALRHLSLGGSPKVAGLQGLPHLRTLDVSAKLDDLGFLRATPELRSLLLTGGSVGDLAGIEACPELQHVCVNHQAKVEVADLAPLAAVRSLRYLQLMYLPRIEDLGWLGEGIAHLELQNLKGLADIDGPGLDALRSLALVGQFGRARDLDLTRLPQLPHLERVALAPLLRKAVGGAEALAALAERDLAILDWRAAVATDLDLATPFG